ncbi:HEAT repeat domain-containing protein, partial [Chloroflexota bacterium]
KMRRKMRTEESEMSLPIEEAIANLVNHDEPLSSSRLTYLSNLNPAETAPLEQAWAAIKPKRRRQILSRLVELAEDDFQLNFDSIFRYCLKDEDAEVRATAIEGLWENEEPSLINPLIILLEQDSSERVQAAAATALGKFAMLAELNKLRSCHASEICHALLATVSDESKLLKVKRRALEAVAPLSIPEVTTAIARAHRSYNSKVKASAIYAMGNNCSPSWLPILLEELSSAEDEIRYEAVGACGELGEEEAAPYLGKLINDPDTNVQLTAIQALGRIGGKEAKERLNQCLNNSSKAIREAAEQALDELEAGEDTLTLRGIV